MQIVVVKCPHALRWLLRAVFKVYGYLYSCISCMPTDFMHFPL